MWQLNIRRSASQKRDLWCGDQLWDFSFLFWGDGVIKPGNTGKITACCLTYIPTQTVNASLSQTPNNFKKHICLSRIPWATTHVIVWSSCTSQGRSDVNTVRGAAAVEMPRAVQRQCVYTLGDQGNSKPGPAMLLTWASAQPEHPPTTTTLHHHHPPSPSPRSGRQLKAPALSHGKKTKWLETNCQ